MKKFLIFILFLTVLIVAEYYFFTEMLSRKRTLVLMPSLVLVIIAIYGIFRFAKKNIINTKHTQSHN
ncbi:MAG: hypothetical protein ACXVMS_10910 [Flavisolibacter sp.]